MIISVPGPYATYAGLGFSKGNSAQIAFVMNTDLREQTLVSVRLTLLVISKIQIYSGAPRSLPGSSVPGWAHLHLTPPLHNATNTQQGPSNFTNFRDRGNQYNLCLLYKKQMRWI